MRFDREKKYQDSDGDTWHYAVTDQGAGWCYTTYRGTFTGVYAEAPWGHDEGEKFTELPPAPVYAYAPGDVLEDSKLTYVVGYDHRLYYVDQNRNHFPQMPGGRRFVGIAKVNGVSVRSPLDDLAVGTIVESKSENRTFVRVPDGWVLATVGAYTSIRGRLQGGDTGARVYITSELPADTKAVS